MAHDYETSKKVAVRIISILGVITIGEVLFALLGKGYIIDGLHFPTVLMGGVMIAMSVIKAYLIVFEFMHMKYEVGGMAKSVLLPLFLLVWGIIAFLWEGIEWKNNREVIQAKDAADVSTSSETGMIYQMKESDLSRQF